MMTTNDFMTSVAMTRATNTFTRFDEDPISPALRAKLLWTLLPPLWLAYMLLIIDRSNFAVAQLGGPNNTAPHGMAQPISAGGLGLSSTSYGLAAGIFFAGYALMQVPSNQLLLRFGARRVLGGCTVCSGVLSACTAFAEDEATLYMLRVLLGLAEAGFFPGCILYISLWLPDNLTGTASAAFAMAAVAGTFVGNVSSGWLMTNLDGVAGVVGWRWLFVCQGVPTALLGLLLLRVVTDTPHDARWLSPLERDALLGALEQDAAAATAAASGTPAAAAAAAAAAATTVTAAAATTTATTAAAAATAAAIVSTLPLPPPLPPPLLPLLPALRGVARRPRTWVLSAQDFVSATIAYLSMFFLPRIVREVLPPATPLWLVGAAASAVAPLQLVFAPLCAAALERLPCGTPRSRRFAWRWGTHALAVLLLLSGGATLLATAARPAAAQRGAAVAMVLQLMLAQLCNSVGMGPFWALHHAAVAEGEGRHISIAIVNTVGGLGGFVGPFVLGWLHDALGPRCPVGTHECVSEWGWGAVVLASSLLLCTVATAVGVRLTGILGDT